MRRFTKREKKNKIISSIHHVVSPVNRELFYTFFLLKNSLRPSPKALNKISRQKAIMSIVIQQRHTGI